MELYRVTIPTGMQIDVIVDTVESLNRLHELFPKPHCTIEQVPIPDNALLCFTGDGVTILSVQEIKPQNYRMN